MAIEGTDLGGGHSAREFDVRTRTFPDESSTVMAKPEGSTRGGLARISEVMRGKRATNIVQALLGLGALALGWRVISASRARRRARWFSRLVPSPFMR